MKKIVLASLSKEDCERIERVQSAVGTLNALLKNHYSTEQERSIINQQLHMSRQDEDELMETLFEKYNIPINSRAQAKISFSDKNIYVMVG